jgi:hypothetical protein
MNKFLGDLCIGGLRLKHLDGELELNEPLDHSAEHLLGGRLSVPAEEKELLEVGRPYRLQIEEGPAGIVIVSRIEQTKDGDVVVEFEPLAAVAGKPR